jgi:hypothetical protein
VVVVVDGDGDVIEWTVIFARFLRFAPRTRIWYSPSPGE